ncbi:hypothetical protein Srufu_076860 [Streptomyces libani subsp. rufus]|nr:hypothetical protein Srufu_076860 [Streptomyces libani subsp. rufus]
MGVERGKVIGRDVVTGVDAQIAGDRPHADLYDLFPVGRLNGRCGIEALGLHTHMAGVDAGEDPRSVVHRSGEAVRPPNRFHGHLGVVRDAEDAFVDEHDRRLVTCTTRINDLVLAPIISRTRPHGDASWLSADQVGEAAVAVALAPTVRDEHITLNTVEDLEAQLARMRT